MRITFALRGDAERKPGGDSKKVAHYSNFLTDRGFEVDVAYSPKELLDSKPDLVHILNLDLPYENLNYALLAEQRHVPVVLSSIHHPWDGVRAYYKTSHDRFFKLLRTAGLDADRGAAVREIAKLAARMSPESSRFLRLAAESRLGTLKAQRTLLNKCSMVFTMAPGEEVALKHDLQYLGSITYVPNGMSFKPPSDTEEPPRLNRVAVVGRVEPRKNSLELARALSALGKEAVFAGRPNSNHEKYVQAFENEIQRNDCLTYAGNLDRNELQTLLRSSTHYVNASWFEVVSQADFEAAALGCRLVSTKWSYLDDFIDFQNIDPSALLSDTAPSILEKALVDSTRVSDVPTLAWDSAAEALIRAYNQF